MFRITRGDDELEISFTLKYDRLNSEYYPDRTFIADSEEEIFLSDDENKLLMEHYYANEDYYLYHNNESIL